VPQIVKHVLVVKIVLRDRLTPHPLYFLDKETRVFILKLNLKLQTFLFSTSSARSSESTDIQESCGMSDGSSEVFSQKRTYMNCLPLSSVRRAYESAARTLTQRKQSFLGTLYDRALLLLWSMISSWTLSHFILVREIRDFCSEKTGTSDHLGLC